MSDTVLRAGDHSSRIFAYDGRGENPERFPMTNGTAEDYVLSPFKLRV